MKGLLGEHFSEHQETALRDPLLFGDYRTALNPEVPRIYEDIQDYDAAKGLFEEVHVCIRIWCLNNFMLLFSLKTNQLCIYRGLENFRLNLFRKIFCK